MFLLVSQDVQTLDFDDGSIRYREATADEHARALRDPRFRDPATGQVDIVAAENQLVKTHIVGWKVTASDGKEVAFTPENLDFVMRNATPDGLFKLRHAVMGGARKAAESGKD